jgi:signal transduction histidine kinase
VTVTVGKLPAGFYVADDGDGISEHDREIIFRAGYSTSENGTGFGLSIVEQIGNTHGWGISVAESATGGTRFEITGVETVGQ